MESIKVYIPKSTQDENGNIVAEKDGNGLKIPDQELIQIPSDIVLKLSNTTKIQPYYVKTGMIIEFTKGNEKVQLTLIVRGDFIEGENEDRKVVGNGAVDNDDGARVTGLNKSKVRKFSNEDLEALDVFVYNTKRFSNDSPEIIGMWQDKTIKPMKPEENN